MSLALVPNLAAAYDQYFGSGLYDTRYPRPNRAMQAAIAAALPADGRGAVLDFGCGTGRYLPLLLAHPGLSVTGYDISRAAITACGRQFSDAAAEGRLRLICGEMPVLQRALEPASQDTILLMFGVLGHVRGRAERVALLRRLHALLRPGGRLVATVPSRRRRFRAEQQACARLVADGVLEPGDILYRRDGAEGSVELYYHLFTAAEFAEDLAAAGFARPRLFPESVLPERGAIAGPGGALLDAALRRVCPLPLAYGFAACVARDAADPPHG
ncbi:class I SAM-dependent methyltransferase [Paracraurococcus ruber]|uniref:class I SAM-dependent methyltransferase n=1 Tax=Paracraurococcus ruber TaxID=77675 RepID=UPI0013052E68|nr:class I SAM-dependent methyltransferase [Paracraurococcus ruber]